ncbi:unnamed protein product [Caenorhabditis angaria]|uniref:Uncharacterized protein n=1 Tax=Caenorhabditis angaria TaxID=860376 RepID=A0A9P1J2H1_9PELO|nr:unnamed protein product [Caenorhabditis angaria]
MNSEEIVTICHVFDAIFGNVLLSEPRKVENLENIYEIIDGNGKEEEQAINRLKIQLKIDEEIEPVEFFEKLCELLPKFTTERFRFQIITNLSCKNCCDKNCKTIFNHKTFHLMFSTELKTGKKIEDSIMEDLEKRKKKICFENVEALQKIKQSSHFLIYNSGKELISLDRSMIFDFGGEQMVLRKCVFIENDEIRIAEEEQLAEIKDKEILFLAFSREHLLQFLLDEYMSRMD